MSEPLEASEVIWGAAAIAKALGRTEAAAYHMLERCQVPGARRWGGRWCLHVPTFRAAFGEPRASKSFMMASLASALADSQQ
jgi:hypothetical protein